MEQQDREQLCRLIHQQRWAALATTQDDGAPFVSYVAYVSEAGLCSILLHVSQLAAHTGFMLARPGVAMAISAPHLGQGDPQTLPRVTLEGRVTVLERDTADYEQARARYLANLPDSTRLFEFGDFRLLRLGIESLRYVGGFGRARTVSGERMGLWAKESGY